MDKQPESFEEKCRRFFEGVGAFQEKIWEDPAARARFESEMEAWDAVLEDGAEEYEDGVPKKVKIPAFTFSEDKPLKRFGRYLMKLRLRAGFMSQDAVIDAVKSSVEGDVQRLEKLVSKSMLSLYERGEIKNIKAQTLWVLAHVYGIEYEELARRWVAAKYRVRGSLGKPHGFVEKIEDETCTLRVPDGALDMEIINLENLKVRQAHLPEGSHVRVAAIDFLDDDVYFPMVLANLKKPVRYSYLLPKDQEDSFNGFVNLIYRADEELGKRIKREMKEKSEAPLVEFIPRPTADLPVCFVIFDYPGDKPEEGFFGLLQGVRVRFFMVADPGLTERMAKSFEFSRGIYKSKEKEGLASQLLGFAVPSGSPLGVQSSGPAASERRGSGPRRRLRNH